MTASALLGFAGLSLLLAMAPGPDTFMVLRYSLRGSRAGLAAAAGSALGSLVWAAVVAVGLASLLEQSATAYRVVKVAGGLYLVYLGLRGLLRRHRDHASPDGTKEPSPSVWAGLRAGLLSCALNPKVGLFFLAVVPQFVPPHAAALPAILTLGAVDTAVALGWLVALALAAARAVGWLRRPRVTKVLDRTSATVLVGFGVATAVSSE